MGLRITKSGKVKTDITEAEFQRQVIEYAHLLGYKVAHFRKAQKKRGAWVTPVAADGKGFFDLVIVHPKSGKIIFAELKTNTGKQSKEQIDWEQWLYAAWAANEKLYREIWRPKDWERIEQVLNQ